MQIQEEDTYSPSPGLHNSTKFVNDMLNANGVASFISCVTDNNGIEAEIVKYWPTHVIIVAYWVVPDKFEILTRLYPDITWLITNHSALPFLATEGVAMDWTLKYVKYPNVFVSSNSPQTNEEMELFIRQADGITGKSIYLPNYYKLIDDKVPVSKCHAVSDFVNVACFGAIRPLKNHLIQAAAALYFSEKIGKRLRFHINSTRIESYGGSVLRNIRGLFKGLTPKHELVEHEWENHTEFRNLISTMDIGLQVSFTETFNIVTADFISMGIPIVVSPEISWMDPCAFASPTNSKEIARVMVKVWNEHKYRPQQQASRLQWYLNNYLKKSKLLWLNYLSK